MVHIVDHLFVLLIFIVQPVCETWSSKAYIRSVEAGAPYHVDKIYKKIIATEWIAFAVLLVTWLTLGRPLAELGFHFSTDTGFWAGMALVIGATGVLLYSSHRAAKMEPEDIEKFRKDLGDLKYLIPRTDGDLRWFSGVSLTAGIVEEVVYRGFLMWYFSQFFPLWGAVLASSLAFGLAHSYQGPKGVIKIVGVGIGFALLFLLSGSLWLPIIMHALLDLIQGIMIRRMYDGEDTHQTSVTV